MKKPRGNDNFYGGFPTNVQLVLLLLGIIIAADHVLLSFDLLHNKNDARDLSEKCWLSNQNLEAMDVNLDAIADEISCSTRLTPNEKDKLQSTVKKLQAVDDKALKVTDTAVAEPPSFKSKSS